MNYSYKTLTLSPSGLRVSGDDQSEKLAELLEKESNALGEKGWEMVNAMPTLSSGGSVSKILVIFRRAASQ